MAPEDDEIELKERNDICQRCERMVEPQELENCPTCNKRFCMGCAYRAGGDDYCSRACGDVFFFGGDVGEDEEMPEE
ncbi:MAG TPA: hypothetical protein VGR00_07505 [Thermoanaerobaculia bacterium]|jgi:hypothetical protein|nr:hypothetical protein [Thermoanaerobaculia bacterium]